VLQRRRLRRREFRPGTDSLTWTEGTQKKGTHQTEFERPDAARPEFECPRGSAVLFGEVYFDPIPPAFSLTGGMNERRSMAGKEGTYSRLPPKQQQLLRGGHLRVVHLDRLGVAGGVVDTGFEEDEGD
jgi:hypothetical protein